MIKSKRCDEKRGCGEMKTENEFYAHPSTADKLFRVCMDCHRKGVRARTQARVTESPEQRRERMRRERADKERQRRLQELSRFGWE